MEVDRENKLRRQQKEDEDIRSTRVLNELGYSDDSLAREYRAEQDRLAIIIRNEEQQRMDAYRRQQAALPFNEREIPFTNEDILRLGGSERFSSFQTNED